ncbi:lactate/malate family dehydrogenase [Streptomyces sp. x-80]|uniref:lactate/malate family dehydrogenase n=1 Tax=Streptomyces sp. x-80 TaxID=2789282 RepID=UPI0039809ABE
MTALWPPRAGAIGVVGAGAVGQTVATALVAAGWCDRVLITSRSPARVSALITDLEDMGTVTASPVRATAAATKDLAECQAIVICPRETFTNTAATDVRMAGISANAPVIAALAECLAGYAGVVVMVTNPVDILTRLFAETSGCRRVYGVGSNTDTARYRLTLARLLGVPPTAVDGHVIGEHGDDAVICASATTINGKPAAIPVEQVRKELTDRPQRINAGIGRTRSGPAGAVLATLRKTLGLQDGIEELSVNHDGNWYGIPLHFTAATPTVCLPQLSTGEARQLAAAARKLHTAYRHLTGGPS